MRHTYAHPLQVECRQIPSESSSNQPQRKTHTHSLSLPLYGQHAHNVWNPHQINHNIRHTHTHTHYKSYADYRSDLLRPTKIGRYHTYIYTNKTQSTHTNTRSTCTHTYITQSVHATQDLVELQAVCTDCIRDIFQQEIMQHAATVVLEALADAAAAFSLQVFWVDEPA
jgi:hypothetical protein